MKVFTCKGSGITAVAVAFNRGHAAKMLAKEFEVRGLKLEKTHPITEIEIDKHKPKGQVVILSDIKDY